jgi:hypothetical protein
MCHPKYCTVTHVTGMIIIQYMTHVTQCNMSMQCKCNAHQVQHILYDYMNKLVNETWLVYSTFLPLYQTPPDINACNLKPLKGQCHEIFDPRFFIKQSPLGPWLTGWNRFVYGFVFAEKIDIIRVSEVSMTPLKPFPRCQWHRWNRFRGVNDTAEIVVSAMSLTPLKL